MKKQRSDRGGLTKVGDLSLLKKIEKEFAPTPANVELAAAVAAIHDAPDAAERAFMARQLVLCTLPHADPCKQRVKGPDGKWKTETIDIPVWSRKSGASTLSIQPGFDEENQCIGFPYGSIPRLLLFWITKEVQQTKNRADLTMDDKRTMHLGRSLNAFMRQVGLSPTTGGGKRGAGRRLHNQMDRLFSARISFIHTTQVTADIRRKNRINMEIAPQSELWWDERRPDQGALFPSWIKLGEEFYAALVEMPVPVDMRALRALKRSPLALDLYAWVCYRAFVIVQKNQPPQFMSWEMLSRQLGTDYTDKKDFKKKGQAALRKVEKLYPGLKIGKAKGGFTVHATRLAVPQSSGGKLLGS